MRAAGKDSGFKALLVCEPGAGRRTVALAELVATVGLALSTIVAAIVVSVGIARANVVGNVIDNEGGLFTIALLLGVVFIAMGGLTLLPRHKPKKH